MRFYNTTEYFLLNLCIENDKSFASISTKILVGNYPLSTPSSNGPIDVKIKKEIFEDELLNDDSHNNMIARCENDHDHNIIIIVDGKKNEMYSHSLI